MSECPQRRGGNTVGTDFVFLNLLEGQPNVPSERALAQTPAQPAVTQTPTDVNINGMKLAYAFVRAAVL